MTASLTGRRAAVGSVPCGHAHVHRPGANMGTGASRFAWSSPSLLAPGVCGQLAAQVKGGSRSERGATPLLPSGLPWGSAKGNWPPTALLSNLQVKSHGAALRSCSDYDGTVPTRDKMLCCLTCNLGDKLETSYVIFQKPVSYSGSRTVHC